MERGRALGSCRCQNRREATSGPLIRCSVPRVGGSLEDLVRTPGVPQWGECPAQCPAWAPDQEGVPPQVTVQVQGQEVLSEKMEPLDFQPHPQTKLRTTESGPETPLGATQKSPMSLQVKEEPEITEDPGEGRQSGQGPRPNWMDHGSLA